MITRPTTMRALGFVLAGIVALGWFGSAAADET
jgi:hypothetical protein